MNLEVRKKERLIMKFALTHAVSPTIAAGERTFMQWSRIDHALALKQHANYCRRLERAGLQVITLQTNHHYPDSVFIEDTAIVFDELAVICSMGTASRTGETAAIKLAIDKHRPCVEVKPPATIEGGDVLQIGRAIFVGMSRRTNSAGHAALSQFLRPYDYQVVPVPVRHCLHLKTACSALDEQTLLVNPDWIDCDVFSHFQLIAIPADEPWAANSLRIGERLYFHAGFRRTVESVKKYGFQVETIDISEFLKAEGGLSCMSILI